MTPVTPPPPTPTKPYKAIVAGVLSFVGALYFELQPRAETLDTMTFGEWFMVILAAVVISGATWFVPNPAKARPRRPV